MKSNQLIAKMIGILLIAGFALAACDSGSGNDLSGVFDERFAPDTPTGIEAKPESSTSITVKWSKVQNARNYKVKRSESEDGPWAITTLSSTTLSYTDTKLKANTQYYYMVIASNKAGDSPDHRPVSATTKSATDNPGTDESNPFKGTWYGKWVSGGNQDLILIFQESFYSWTLVDGGGWGFSGAYTYSGNYATLHGEMPGTAEIKGKNLLLTCGYLGAEPVICSK